MSKSLKRVRATLEAAGFEPIIRETAQARTAQAAADALGCDIDQIAKTVVFAGQVSGEVAVFITAGGRQVDMARAIALMGEPLGKADAGLVRAQTGFAIGGVSPIGHISQTRKWFDESLFRFDTIWAAAGTPHHVFTLSPQEMLILSDAQLADF